MTHGIVTLGPQRKYRTPQSGTILCRNFNNQARGLVEDSVAKSTYRLILALLILATARLPPSLMRPERRYKLTMRVQFVGWNHSTGLVTKEPHKGVLQKTCSKAARQALPCSLREPAA